jgi:peptidoglycan hydrolase-like protein with peptidoglycan-binding domain
VGILQARVKAVRDGDFGPATTKKVEAFQKRFGLVADGIVGPDTWGAVLQGPDIRKGNVSARVRLVQLIVGVPNDGRFGDRTALALKKVQRYLGETTTGVFGKGTRLAVTKFWKKQEK